MEKGGNIKHELQILNPNALFADGFDEALLGYTAEYYSVSRAVYSANKMVEILKEREGVSDDSARADLEYNVFGSYFGESSPVYVWMN